MKDRKLATRYARGLLPVLRSSADAEAADGFLQALAAAIGRSGELKDVLLNPAISRSHKKMILTRIAQAQSVPREVLSFLAVVIDHGRASALPEIATAFHEERESRMGIVHATITTAVPMTPDLEARARAALGRSTGKQIRLSTSVDPALLGGAVTRIGSTVYDGSVRTQLATLRRRMAGE